MITTALFVKLAVAHLVGDFLFQSNWMALNKSKNTAEGYQALAAHCTIYGLCFLWMGIEFATITAVLHTITDFYTSRRTSALWFIHIKDAKFQSPAGLARLHDHEGNPTSVVEIDWHKRHWFFVMLGLDQFIHMVCLVWLATFDPLFGRF